jgi:hypothetical protein
MLTPAVHRHPPQDVRSSPIGRKSIGYDDAPEEPKQTIGFVTPQDKGTKTSGARSKT